VKFHDGEPWNAHAAKANLDHVLHPALVTPDFHGWYVATDQASLYLKRCNTHVNITDLLVHLWHLTFTSGNAQ